MRFFFFWFLEQACLSNNTHARTSCVLLFGVLLTGPRHPQGGCTGCSYLKWRSRAVFVRWDDTYTPQSGAQSTQP